MANLIFAQLIPDAIIYDDTGSNPVAYHYVGTTASAPNADVGDITDQNIPAYTFNDGDPQGKTAYTKCEHAVAFYFDAFYKEVTMTVTGTLYTLYTAPSAGVARIYSIASIIVYVNGTQVLSAFSANKIDAKAINLNNGDVVTVKTTDAGGYLAIIGFLPDTY